MKITDAIHEFILYKQSLGMTYKSTQTDRFCALGRTR